MNKKSIFHQRSFIILGLALILATIGFTLALAATDGVINACVLKDGTLYIVQDPICKKNETLLTWNIMGPQGDPGLACWDLNGNGSSEAGEDINGDGYFTAADCKGPQGEQGTQGIQGEQGAQGIQGEQGEQGEQGIQGEQGPAGPASLTALQGTACTVGGYAGTVEITIAPDTGAVSMVCQHSYVTLSLIQFFANQIKMQISSGVVLDAPKWWSCGSGCFITSEVLQDLYVKFERGSVVSYVEVQNYYMPFTLTCPDGTQVTSTYENSVHTATCGSFTMDGDKTISP